MATATIFISRYNATLIPSLVKNAEFPVTAALMFSKADEMVVKMNANIMTEPPQDSVLVRGLVSGRPGVCSW